MVFLLDIQLDNGVENHRVASSHFWQILQLRPFF